MNQAIDCTREKDLGFESLSVDDYFTTKEEFSVLRQVVLDGVYRRSVVVGRWSNHRVAMNDTVGEVKTNHGSAEIVHKVILSR